jgi:hypothetical protein
MAEEGVSSQAAYKTRLEDYATILRLLKRADSDECGRILEDLRRPKSMTDGVKDVLERWVESEWVSLSEDMWDDLGGEEACLKPFRCLGFCALSGGFDEGGLLSDEVMTTKVMVFSGGWVFFSLLFSFFLPFL